MNGTDGERGAVLVAGLVILALLSLLGAGSLLNATLDTQLAANQSRSGEAFYAAEAGLEAGVGFLQDQVRANLRPYDPSGTGWSVPAGPVDFTDLNGYRVEVRLSYAGTTTPAGDPEAYPFSSLQSGQQLESDAYTYRVESRASSINGDGSGERMSETLQVLETPLVQFYVFFDDDLGWHPGDPMVSWGRVHTNGDLGFANLDPVTFRNYDDNDQETPCVLTAAGSIRFQDQAWLQQNGGWGTRNTDPVYVRVNNLTAIPAGAPPSADYVEIDTTIGSHNQAAQQARFQDADDVFHVRAGVDRMPAASFQDIARGGFYETEAGAPRKPGVDGLLITADAGLRLELNPFDGPPANVTALVQAYEVAPGVDADLAGWSLGARVNADGSTAPATAVARGSIVYTPGDEVLENDGRTTAYSNHRGNTANPWYPCVLEVEDGRENQEVDLLVIDLQRLQHWYADYLDQEDNGALDGSVDLTARRLLIYTSRTGAATATAGALQALKLVGSRAGRTRNLATDEQQSPTLLVPTTLVTDNPVYLEGDFNAPGHNAGDRSPGAVGCAVVSDALTLLSNHWGANYFATPPSTGGPHAPLVTDYDSVFNAALFTGRYDFRQFPTAGEEAGIHNLPHFLEDWDGSGAVAYPNGDTPVAIIGCLVSLWFSQQSDGVHGGGYYNPPDRIFGWDRQFADRNYWPPYVPSIFSVERTAWRED